MTLLLFCWQWGGFPSSKRSTRSLLFDKETEVVCLSHSYAEFSDRKNFCTWVMPPFSWMPILVNDSLGGHSTSGKLVIDGRMFLPLSPTLKRKLLPMINPASLRQLLRCCKTGVGEATVQYILLKNGGIRGCIEFMSYYCSGITSHCLPKKTGWLPRLLEVWL